MDYLFQIFGYGIEGYKAYETSQIVNKNIDNLYKLLTLAVVGYFAYKILRG